MVEYALLVGLIAVVAVVAITALGGGISGLFSSANNSVGNATQRLVQRRSSPDEAEPVCLTGRAGQGKNLRRAGSKDPALRRVRGRAGVEPKRPCRMSPGWPGASVEAVILRLISSSVHITDTAVK